MGCENSGADVLCSCPAPNFLSPPPLFNLQIAKLLCDRKSVQCGLQAHAYIHTACRRECMNAADTRLRFAAPDLRLYHKCKLYIPCRKVLHQTTSACRTSGTYRLGANIRRVLSTLKYSLIYVPTLRSGHGYYLVTSI